VSVLNAVAELPKAGGVCPKCNNYMRCPWGEIYRFLVGFRTIGLVSFTPFGTDSTAQKVFPTNDIALFLEGLY
jgi:hypothetical protein